MNLFTHSIKEAAATAPNSEYGTFSQTMQAGRRIRRRAIETAAERVCFSSATFVAAMPSDIEYMPEGFHEIEATVSGKPGRAKVNVSESVVSKLNRALSSLIAKAGQGQGSFPYVDFDHKGGKSAAIPRRFFWKDGVRLALEWTKAGKEAIEGKNYQYFSPELIINRETGEVVGLGDAGAIGGLVNTPAFQSIERISA